MIPFIKKYLFDNWPNLDFGQVPDDLKFIKFEDRQIRSSNVSIITFLVKSVSDGKEEPALIVKTPRYYLNQYANLTLKNEQNNLKLFQNRLQNKQILNSLPRVIFSREINNSLVLGESHLSGSLMSTSIFSDDIDKVFIRNFNIAFDWLANFQNNWDSNEVEFCEYLINESIKPIFDQYRYLFPDKIDSHNIYFNSIIERFHQFIGMPIKLLPQQMDFHASNIFVEQSAVSGVIDWEDFKENGIPFFDLFHFIITYFECLYESFAEIDCRSAIEILSTSDKWKNTIKSCINKYASAISAREEFTDVFFQLFLIESINLAGDPRKKAANIIPIKEYLISFGCTNIYDYLLFMTIPYYYRRLKKAVSLKNDKLAAEYEAKINSILNKEK